MTVSTIGEEKAFNPRLQVSSPEEYAEIMNNLHLPAPKMMDVAVPSNRAIGLDQQRGLAEGWGIVAADAIREAGHDGVLVVDVREGSERRAQIPGSVHAPYDSLDDHLAPGGLLAYQARSGGKRLLLYFSYGERSAMAAEAARDAGIEGVRSVVGGMVAWLEAGGPVSYGDQDHASPGSR